MTTKIKSVSSACPECANCGVTGITLNSCSRCKLVKYCCKDCQRQHWTKGEHKKFCVAVDNRKPQTIIRTMSNLLVDESEGEECAMCMSPILNSNACLLPCSHSYHSACVAQLRKFGISQVCPLCRAELPVGPELLFEEAARRYIALQNTTTLNDVAWLSKNREAEIREFARLLCECANQGHVGAQFNLAAIYEQGIYVKLSYSEAIKWYRKAADQGDAAAQCNLGSMYAAGRGVTQSDSESAQWYRKAADQGVAAAQCNLGFMSDKGRGVQQSDSEAAQWYLKAGDQGDADAQFSLGSMYDEGRGVEQSDSEASEWWRKAAVNGHTGAVAALARLGSEIGV